MQALALWLVQQPGHIAWVGLAHLAVWLLLRGAPACNRFWVPGLLWLGYAAWEWLVMVKSPEADIRVDLMLIWPLLALAMLWAGYRALKPR